MGFSHIKGTVGGGMKEGKWMLPYCDLYTQACTAFIPTATAKQRQKETDIFNMDDCLHKIDCILKPLQYQMSE